MEVTVGLGTILLEKYRVESVLGRGGMGIVLKVTHLHLGEELAMKVLLPEGAIRPDLTSRFLREAQAVVRLRGEHVARVTDVGVLPEGLPFIVMEYLHGVDLSRELKQRTTLSPGTAADYVLQACEALAEAHAHGIVHRDVKPANLFLTTRPDGTPLVKVLDFGISKVPVGATSTLTQTEVVMGTPGYMSPEQMKATRDVDARTDIWALGIVLYEFLTGRRPFDGESFSATVLIAGTEPPPPMSPRIPRGLQAVVLRCLEKDRRARYPTIAALAAALAPFASTQRDAATIVERTNLLQQRPRKPSELAGLPARESTITTLSGSASSGLRPRRRRTHAGALWLIAAVGALIGAGLVMFGHLRDSDTPTGDRSGSQGTRPAAEPTGSGSTATTGSAAPTHNDSSALVLDAGPDSAAMTQTSDAGAPVATTAPGNGAVPGNGAGADAAVDTSAVAHASDAGVPDAARQDTGNASTKVAGREPGANATDKKHSAGSPTPAPSPPRPPRPIPPPAPPVPKTGVIVVRVKHSWAEVWIDEKEAGTTPVRASVPAGVHKVLLVGDGHREQVMVNVTGEIVIDKNW